ncbi:MAG: helix-turn-helix domain-containing protein [Actinomycetota bacterium]
MASAEQPKTSHQLQLSFASPYLSIEQVAALIGVPKSFIYRRTARGHGDPIPHYRLGGHLRFKLDDIESWIENHRSLEPEPQRTLVAANRPRARASSRQKLIRKTQAQ